MFRAAADWDEKYGLEGLTGERALYANRTLAFMSDMDAKFFDRTKKLNGELALEARNFSADAYEYDVRVSRGPVVEKIGRMIGIITKVTSRIQKETVFSR